MDTENAPLMAGFPEKTVKHALAYVARTIWIKKQAYMYIARIQTYACDNYDSTIFSKVR